jgi:coproporphyrinogen III oxidase-like Fe-S oxidoreductase
VKITAQEAQRRAIILGLQELELDRLPHTFDGKIAEPYGSILQTALELGLFELRGKRLHLTERGYLHRDAICWSLFSNTMLERHAAFGSEFVDAQRFLSVA